MLNVLHLHPHKHTGKLLHHRHTSYHALLLLLAIAGGFIGLTNHLAHAASYDVSAIVPAPLPTTAAVITTPSDGAAIQTSDIAVAGTCPIITPAIIIVIYDNGNDAGSVRCGSTGTFSVPVSLTIGAHEFIATIINFTGQTGLSSSPVHIIYSQSVATSPPTISPPNSTHPTTNDTPVSSSPNPNPNPPSNVGTLVLDPNSPFLVFGPETDTVWDGMLSGGTGPYTIQIDWGDGSVQTYTSASGGSEYFRHRYTTSGTFLITIHVEDAAGHSLTRHYVALSPVPLYTSPINGSGGSNNIGGKSFAMMPVLYTTYIVTVFCFFGLWLYEKRHRRQLVPIRIATHRNAQHYHHKVIAAKQRRHR